MLNFADRFLILSAIVTKALPHKHTD